MALDLRLRISGTPRHSEEDQTNLYFERFLMIRTQLLQKSDLQETIKGVFGHVYKNEPLPPFATFIGRGSSHIVYSIGNVINSSTGEAQSVGVRLHHDENYPGLPYYLEAHRDTLTAQLDCFERAYAERRNPPSFVGIVTAQGYGSYPKLHSAAFLVEDLSDAGKRLILSDVVDSRHEYCLRIEADGSFKQFFIDPVYTPELKENGLKYLAPNARLDL